MEKIGEYTSYKYKYIYANFQNDRKSKLAIIIAMKFISKCH